jgi:methylase of polypeptide subunit release factors
MTQYRRINYGPIAVHYLDEIDGGGARFGQDYLALIPERIGKAEHALEWCAGPGFIGFSLLAAGLCAKLTLIDVNPVATAACRETVRNNGLADRVSVYDSDCMDAVPPGEVYDLVVANPPHCSDTTPSPGGHTQLIYNDVGWRVHRKFYRQIPQYLSDHGRVILQEDASLSGDQDFRAMIEDSGLELLETFPCVWAKEYYYVESRLSETYRASRPAPLAASTR